MVENLVLLKPCEKCGKIRCKHKRKSNARILTYDELPNWVQKAFERRKDQ